VRSLFDRKEIRVRSGRPSLVGLVLAASTVIPNLHKARLVAFGRAVEAVRGAAFAIPGAFGAQEAGMILLCGISCDWSRPM
jgi:hypothetical protein